MFDGLIKVSTQVILITSNEAREKKLVERLEEDPGIIKLIPKKQEKWMKRPRYDVVLGPGLKTKLKGNDLVADKNGVGCSTHRARSKSYVTVEKIPQGKINFIASTG